MAIVIDIDGNELLRTEEFDRIVYYDGTSAFLGNQYVKHRLGGPATIDKKTKFEAFYFQGQLHNANGPAISNPRLGQFEYWIHGYNVGLIDFTLKYNNPNLEKTIELLKNPIALLSYNLHSITQALLTFGMKTEQIDNLIRIAKLGSL